MTQPERIEITVNLNIGGDPTGSFPPSFGRMLCDLVEEATRRGMEVGARMVLDAENPDDDPEQPRVFPGFLGADDDAYVAPEDEDR